MKYIALDTETFLFSRGNKAPEIVCMTTCDDTEAKIFTHYDGDIEAEAKRLLLDDDIILVGHTMCFDMAVLMKNYKKLTSAIFAKYSKGLIRDTGIRHRLMDIRQGGITRKQSLSALCELIGVTLGKTGDAHKTRTNYESLAKTPLDHWPIDAVQYAMDDAIGTYKLWSKCNGSSGLL